MPVNKCMELFSCQFQTFTVLKSIEMALLYMLTFMALTEANSNKTMVNNDFSDFSDCSVSLNPFDLALPSQHLKLIQCQECYWKCYDYDCEETNTTRYPELSHKNLKSVRLMLGKDLRRNFVQKTSVSDFATKETLYVCPNGTITNVWQKNVTIGEYTHENTILKMDGVEGTPMEESKTGSAAKINGSGAFTPARRIFHCLKLNSEGIYVENSYFFRCYDDATEIRHLKYLFSTFQPTINLDELLFELISWTPIVLFCLTGP